MKSLTAPSWPLIFLSVLLGILLGSGAYTAYYANGLSYLSNDPAACVNCHIMREHYDGWQKAGHHAVATCNDCHVPHALIPKYLAKAENGYRHSKAFTLQDFHEPIRIRPSNSELLRRNCIECHQEMVAWIVALDDEEHTLSCVHCHTDVGHGPTK